MDPDETTKPPSGEEEPAREDKKVDRDREVRGVSLEEQVKQLHEAMAETQRTINAADATLGQQRWQLEALTTRMRDAERSRATYANEHPALAQKDADLRDYLRNERRCLEQILGREAERVRTVVADQEEALKRLETKQEEAEAKLKQLQQDLEAADKAREEPKRLHDALKGLAAALKARFQRLDALRADVKKAHDVGDYAIAYRTLDLRFQKTLDEKPAVIAPDDLPQALEEAWAAHREAEKDHSLAKAEEKSQQAILATAKAAADDARKNLEARILDELRKIKPPQDQAA